MMTTATRTSTSTHNNHYNNDLNNVVDNDNITNKADNNSNNNNVETNPHFFDFGFFLFTVQILICILGRLAPMGKAEKKSPD